MNNQLVELLKINDGSSPVINDAKTRQEIVKLLIDAQKLENEQQKVVLESMKAELEFSNIMRAFELEHLCDEDEDLDDENFEEDI